MLTWQCRRCGTEVNYHAYHELDPAIVKQIDHVPLGMKTPQQMARTFLQRPESYFGKTYEKDGFEPARFVCKDCKAAGKYKKIHVKNIPTFRSAVQEYILVKGEVMPRLMTFAGYLEFKHVSIVELAREFYRRFYSYSERDSLIDIEPIFPNTNRYLANTSDTHAVFFGFEEMLQRFLMTHPQAHECHEANSQCTCRQQKTTTYDEANEEERESTGPKPELLSWERGRKPDPRRKWCRVVQNLVPGKVCPGEQQFCPECPHFEPQLHLKYLILHTLEHAIIAAMPKYTGINKNQIREIVYPNDTSDYDCALIDSTVGARGAFTC
ncbi:hypothetical protein [Ktedonobacter sp. SOSP1-52]|uniref:hypothetical protein n=1 Tax=Ktedonobacter sp. SOSP1-52 TaxID=2778366 RepID=UPI0019162E3C|nr:hypothetical protein [Ktedonobacter sp. SOSP1-52]